MSALDAITQEAYKQGLDNQHPVITAVRVAKHGADARVREVLGKLLPYGYSMAQGSLEVMEDLIKQLSITHDMTHLQLAQNIADSVADENDAESVYEEIRFISYEARHPIYLALQRRGFTLPTEQY